MEPSTSNFHCFIFCQRGLQLTTVFHFDLTQRRPGHSGLRAHRMLVDHLEGGRTGGERVEEPPMFPGQIMSVQQASRLMESIPQSEQAHHVWSTATGAEPIQLGSGRDRIYQMGLLNESFDNYTGPHAPVSSLPWSPVSVGSRARRVGRFSRPVIVRRSTSAHSTVHVSSSTSLASHVTHTVQDGHTSYGGNDDLGSDIGEPVGDVNTNAFVYSSTSLYSIVSSRSDGAASDHSDNYAGRIRHDLIYSTSTSSLSSVDSTTAYRDAPSDVAGPSQPDDNLPPPVEIDNSQIIETWLAGMEERTRVLGNVANTTLSDQDNAKQGRKRKVPDCEESCTRLSEKPIAVVRPIMAAAKRRRL